jgi:hypothetical protein
MESPSNIHTFEEYVYDEAHSCATQSTASIHNAVRNPALDFEILRSYNRDRLLRQLVGMNDAQIGY